VKEALASFTPSLLPSFTLSLLLVVPGARPGSIPDAKLGPAAELEMLIGQEPLAFRRLGLGEVPEQELLAYRRSWKPDPRLQRRVQVGIFRPKSRLPDVPRHRTSLPSRSWSAYLVLGGP
jgi:hypothetical protein